MKLATQDDLVVASPQPCEILDLIRKDRELIDRLKITSQELEELSKCALFGTLTCKSDMLFILRLIREGGGPLIDQPSVFSQPATPETEEEDPVPPECRRIPVPLAGTAVSQPGSLESVARQRMPEQFGVLFWGIVLAGGLAWNLVIAMSRWRNNFMAGIGMPAAQAHPSAASAAWYSNLDQPYILLCSEVLLVAAFAVVIYLNSLRARRRFKVRPGRSWR